MTVNRLAPLALVQPVLQNQGVYVVVSVGDLRLH
jgi:hypothetical protein